MRSKRRRRSEDLHRDKALALEHDSGLIFNFPLHHMTEHAFANIVIVAQRLVQSVANLARNHRSRDQLRMRMLQAGAGIEPVVLEDRDVVHAMVQAQRVVPLLINTQNLPHLLLAEKCYAARVVRAVDDHFVESKTVNAPPQVLQASRWLHLARECRKLVGNYPHLPSIAFCRRSHHLGGSLVLVSRAKGTSFHEGRGRLSWAVRDQFFWPLGPFRGDDDPFLRKEVLA